MKSILTICLFLVSSALMGQNIYDGLLFKALTEEKYNDASYWLEKGANINQLDTAGISPLHFAVINNNNKLSEWLLQHGAYINVTDKNGSTPLMYSAYYGNLRICYLLFTNGANLSIKDYKNKTASDYAYEQGFLRVSEFIRNPLTYSEEPTYIEYYELLNRVDKEIFSKKTIELAENTTNSLAKELIPQHPDYFNLLIYIAEIYYEQGIFQKAEILLLQAIETIVQVKGKMNVEYNEALGLLIFVYESLNKTEKVELLLIQLLQLQKELFGENSPKYIMSLGSLAIFYDEQMKYAKAEQYYLQAIKLWKEVQGELNQEYIGLLNGLGLLYLELDIYIKAEPLFIKTLEIRQVLLENNHPDIAYSLNNLGSLYSKQENYQKAEEYFQQALQIEKESRGERNADYATTLNNLADLYKNKGVYIKAEPLFLKIIQIRKEVIGDKHPDFVNSLKNLADLYTLQGNYIEAEILYEQALTIIKNNYSDKDLNYAGIINNQAILFHEIGQYEKAELLLKEAAQIRKEIKGENSSDYASSLNALCNIYHDQGKFEEEKQLLLDILLIRKTIHGENSLIYATTLNSLAVLYSELGDYKNSEILNLQSLNIAKTVGGEKNPKYAMFLNNLAALYFELGNYKKAESLSIQALQTVKEIFGEFHPDYLLLLGNLAQQYSNTGRYDEAEPLFLNCLKGIKEISGEKNIDYSLWLNNLAVIYMNQKKYGKAEDLYQKAIQLHIELFGVEHPFYATLLNNLGYLYMDIMNYSMADSLFEQSMKIRKKVFGENHPDYIVSLNNLGLLFTNIGDFSNAERFYSVAFNQTIKNTAKNFEFLSEKERNLFWETIEFYLNIGYPSFIFRFYQESMGTSFAYKNVLFTKYLLLNTARKVQETIMNTRDSKLIHTWSQMNSIRKRINFLETQPKEYQYKLPDLEEEANQLDKLLTQKSQEYRQSKSSYQIQWQDVQNKLKEGEAAVEFSSFQYYKKGLTDSTLYCVLVLKKEMKFPLMIYLFEQKQLDSLFVGGKADANYLYASRGVETIYNPVIPNGKKLYNLIWKPLEESLADVKTVYYSPSGTLHQVAFAALPIDTASYLCDKYNLVQLSSTRQLATSDWQSTPGQISNATLFGGIKYDLDSLEVAEIQRSIPQPTEGNISRGFVSDSTLRSGSINFLEGTKIEVDSISLELQSQNINTTLYTGIGANEETFKSLTNQNIDVLHIATHGFFFPDIKEKPEEMNRFMLTGEQRFRNTPNPLLRSGLFLAGGNHAWKGEAPFPGLENGVLTAQEISEMYLPNTELVVLSACETGLGDIQGGEGVFGLQRAFKLAGAKSILMSLWKVPDASTSEMMQLFYSKWLSGMDKHEAFRETQLEMRNRYPKSPKDWAGFVMLD